MIEDIVTVALPSFIGGIVFFGAATALLSMANVPIPRFRDVWRLAIAILVVLAITTWTPILIDRAADGLHPFFRTAFITQFIWFWIGAGLAHYLVSRRMPWQ